MPSAFVPLREWFAPPYEEVAPALEPIVEEIIVPAAPEDEPCDARMELLADIRLFRAKLAESLDHFVGLLLREIAVEVLARELELAPSDIAAVVQFARERYACDEPLGIRAHPSEVALLEGSARVVGDATLRPGDVVLEVHGGTIDATLGMRLTRVLRGFER